MASINNEFNYQKLMGELAAGTKELVWTDAYGWTPVLTEKGRKDQDEQYKLFGLGVPEQYSTLRSVEWNTEDTATVLNCLESSDPKRVEGSTPSSSA